MRQSQAVISTLFKALDLIFNIFELDKAAEIATYVGKAWDIVTDLLLKKVSKSWVLR